MSVEDEYSSFLSHLKQLFDKQGIHYEPIKFPDGSELLTFKIKTDEGLEIEMYARATPDDVWLYIFGRVGNLEDVSSKVQYVHSLMQMNMVTMGVKIALNNENDIILMSATNNTNLTNEQIEEILDNFDFVSSEIQSLSAEF